jgi:transcriptional regulator with XRE-family HTH domain
MAQQRHDRAKMEVLLARRERRGLTFAQLSVSSGIPVPTLSWWCSRLRRERAAGEGFVEVAPVAQVAVSDARIEIALRSGRQLVVREAIAPATLAALVSALEA